MSNPNEETHNNIAQTDDVDKFCNFTLVFPTLFALFTPEKSLLQLSTEMEFFKFPLFSSFVVSFLQQPDDDVDNALP